MARKKSKSTLKIVLSVVEIVLAALIICTLAFNMFKIVGELLGSETTNYLSTTSFLSDVFSGDITNGWAIATLVAYILVLIASVTVILFEILNIFGVKIKKLPKNIFQISLLILCSLFVIIALIFAGVATKDQSIVAGSITIAKATMSVSLTPILSPIFSVGVLIANIFKK